MSRSEYKIRVRVAWLLFRRSLGFSVRRLFGLSMPQFSRSELICYFNQRIDSLYRHETALLAEVGRPRASATKKLVVDWTPAEIKYSA